MPQPEAEQRKQPEPIDHQVFVLRKPYRKMPCHSDNAAENQQWPDARPKDRCKNLPGKHECVHDAYIGMLGHFVNR